MEGTQSKGVEVQGKYCSVSLRRNRKLCTGFTQIVEYVHTIGYQNDYEDQFLPDQNAGQDGDGELILQEHALMAFVFPKEAHFTCKGSVIYVSFHFPKLFIIDHALKSFLSVQVDHNHTLHQL